MRRAGEIQDDVTGRVLELQIGDYVSANGALAADNHDTETFSQADVIVQVLLDVSGKGYTTKANLYDKATSKWFSFGGRTFSERPGQKPVTELIVDEVLPQVLVRLFELSSQRPVLFADCLFPQPNDDPMEPLARQYSVEYGTRLEASLTLRQKFTVMPLVTTANPTFFRWWCVTLQNPRVGILRDETTTVHGYILPSIAPQKPNLFLQVRRPSQAFHPRIVTLPFDPQDGNNLLIRIIESVEQMTNDM
jgi:hypothetical protein